MGRNKKTDPTVEVKIRVPSSLAARLELYIFDPIRKRASYGVRSTIFVNLLREWLDKQDKAKRKLKI